MTREEKIERINNFCSNFSEKHKFCNGCPIREYDYCRIDFKDWTNEYFDTVMREIDNYEGNEPNEVEKELEELEKDFDTVERPQHYASTSIECIDAMIETQGVVPVFHFCVCNAFKYLWRHEKKNGFEDLKKASWYLNKAIELKEKCDE